MFIQIVDFFRSTLPFYIRKLNVLLFICSTGTFCKCQNHTKHINSDSIVDEMRKYVYDCIFAHKCRKSTAINKWEKVQREKMHSKYTSGNQFRVMCCFSDHFGFFLHLVQFHFNWLNMQQINPTTAAEASLASALLVVHCVLIYLKCIHEIILKTDDGEFFPFFLRNFSITFEFSTVNFQLSLILSLSQ